MYVQYAGALLFSQYEHCVMVLTMPLFDIDTDTYTDTVDTDTACNLCFCESHIIFVIL